MISLRGGTLTFIRNDGTCGIVFTQHPRCNTITIGSRITCDVRIQNANIRKVHCIIFVDTLNNVIKLQNLSKKNPTLLNGLSIKKEHVLTSADRITIGGRTFLWTYTAPKKSNRCSVNLETKLPVNDAENIKQIDNISGTNEGVTQSLNKNDIREKKVGRRITCKINKIPIGNIGKRLKARKRVTVHEFRGCDPCESFKQEEEGDICEDGNVNNKSENKAENTITPEITITEHDQDSNIEDLDVENVNTTISRSTVKSNNTTPLKDITKLQEKNIITTPKGHHTMFPLEASTPFQVFENKNLSTVVKLAQLEKSDSLIWSVSPATLSHRSTSVAKSFTSTSHKTRAVNELIDVDLHENAVIKKTISSSVYLIDLTTPNTSNLSTSLLRTPNKSAVKPTLLKSAIKNASSISKTQKSLHTTANPTIKKSDRSPMVSNSIKKVLNMSNVSSGGTPAGDKRKTLFLNKSMTPCSTSRARDVSKTPKLTLSTVNKRKTVNVLETPGRRDKMLDDREKSSYSTVGGTPSLLRKSLGYPSMRTPVNKACDVTRVKPQFNISNRGETCRTPNKTLLSTKIMEADNDSEILYVTASDDTRDEVEITELAETTDKQISTNDLTNVTIIEEAINSLEDLLQSSPSNHSTNDVMNVTIDVCEIKETMRTSEEQISIKDITTIESVKELLNTPTCDTIKDEKKTPVKHSRINTVDLTNVVGVKELLNTPPRDDLRDVRGVKELMKTPGNHIPTNDLTDVLGVRELMNTPAQDDLRDVRGVEELMKTPGNHIPTNDLTDVLGVRELLNTPAQDDLRDVRGVKELMKTPGNHIPTNDLTDVLGVRELMNTPAQDDLRDVRGVKELMKTPGNHIPTNDLTDVSGVRELLNTPAQDDLRDVRGVKELFNTPQEGHNPDFTVNFDTFTNIINTSYDVGSGSKNVSICSLPSINIVPATTNVEEIEDLDDQDDDTEFNEDFISKNTSLDENKTMDQTFDELIGKQTITKTYSRKKSISPEKRNNLTDFQTENIEKWVESVVNVGIIEEVPAKPNNNQQILSNRYSNVTPQTSVIEPLEHNKDDIEEDDDSDKLSSRNSEAELDFEKSAIIDPIDPHVSFRFENDNLSYESESERSESVSQTIDAQDESALLNEDADIIPSTQVEQTPRRLTRQQLETNESNQNTFGNDSKDTFIIEDDVIIPETQVEVYQEDDGDDNQCGLEMSSQALETNISLVLNGEEEILSGLVDNNEDGSCNSSFIEETQMPQNLDEPAIVAKNRDSSILFIDDTIFMDKSMATPTSNILASDSDDSSIIFCDLKTVSAANLHRTRSKSETPKKDKRKTLIASRKTMGDKLNETPFKISKFQSEVVQRQPYIEDPVDVSNASLQEEESITNNSKSTGIIDLSDSFNDTGNESTNLGERLNDKLESEISGIETLQNDESSCLDYENSDDEMIDGVFDHMEKSNISKVNETLNKSQKIVDKCLENDSDIFENLDETNSVQKPNDTHFNDSRNDANSNEASNSEDNLPQHDVSTKTIDAVENKSASQLIVEECLEMDADVFENFDENEIVRQARRASFSPENIKSNKVSRKTVGDFADKKDGTASKFASEINTIDLSVDVVEEVPKIGRRRAMSSDRLTKMSSEQFHNKTISNINTESTELVEENSNCEINDDNNESQTATKEVTDAQNTTPTSIDVLNQSSIILCDDSGVETTQLRSVRSKSLTPKKVERQSSNPSRKTMGDSANIKSNIDLQSSSISEGVWLTVPRLKSKSFSPQKSPKSSIVTNKSASVIDLNESDDASVVNDVSSCVLVYADSEDEVIDSVFDDLDKNQSIDPNSSQNENKSKDMVGEGNEMNSEVFENFNEKPAVRQDRGASLSPTKDVKLNNLKASRKTMGDRLDVKEKVASKFESEINDISMSVGDINDQPLVVRRRAMSICNKVQSSSENFHNKTISEINCENPIIEEFQNFIENPVVVCQVRGTSLSPTKDAKLPSFKVSRKTMGDKLDMKEKVRSNFESELNNISLTVDDIDQAPLIVRRRAKSIDRTSKLPSENVHNKTIAEIDCEKHVKESSVAPHLDLTVQKTEESLISSVAQSTEKDDVLVSANGNLDDTFEHDESENLFNDEESEMIVPETQEVSVQLEKTKNAESILIIPETQQQDDVSILDNSQPDKSIQNRTSQLHKLSLNSPNRSKSSPIQNKSQSPPSDKNEINLVENLEVVESADAIIVENAEVVDDDAKTSTVEEIQMPTRRKRRLYSKETYDFENHSDKRFQHNPTSTPLTKNRNNLDIFNISEEVITSSEDTSVKSGRLEEEQGNVDKIDSENSQPESKPDENFKLGRRVVFADKAEEKYFDVLSEYENSIQQPVRGRNRGKAASKKKNIELEATNEQLVKKKTTGRGKKQRAPAQKIQEAEMTSNTNEKVETELNIQLTSIETIPDQDEKDQNSGGEKNRRGLLKQKVNNETTNESENEIATKMQEVDESIPQLEKENISEENLGLKTSNRGRGRSGKAKQNENEIQKEKEHGHDDNNEMEILGDDVEAIPLVEEETNVAVEILEQKKSGRGRGRRVQEKKITEELITSTNENVNINEEPLQEKASVRGRGRWPNSKKNKINSSNDQKIDTIISKSIEEIPTIEENRSFDELLEPKKSGRAKNQKITEKQQDIEILETNTDDKNVSNVQLITDNDNKNLEVTHDEKVVEKPPSRGRGRRAVTKDSETKTDDQNEIAMKIPSAIDNIKSKLNINEFESSDDEKVKKVIGRGRGRKVPVSNELEVIGDSNTDVLSKEAVDTKTTGRGIRRPTKKNESFESVAEVVNTSTVGVTESEVSDVTHTTDTKRAPRRKKTDEVTTNNIESKMESTTTEDLEHSKTPEKSGNGKEIGRGKGKVTKTIPTSIFATPTEPVSRTRRINNKKIMEVTDSETEQVPKSPPIAKSRRIIRKPKRYQNDDSITKEDTINAEEISEMQTNTSINKKDVSTKLETPVKSRGRRGARKQNSDEKANDADGSSNEHVDQVHEGALEHQKIEKTKSTEIPVKPRGRRGAQKQHLDEKANDADASINDHVDPSEHEKPEKVKSSKSETPVKPRGRRGAQKQNEKSNDADGTSSKEEVEEIHKVAAKLETPLRSRGRSVAHIENVIDTSTKEPPSVSNTEQNDNKEETPVVMRGRGRRAKLISETNISIESVKDDTPVKSRGRRAVVALTETIEIPTKRGRKNKQIDTSKVDLPDTDLLISSSTESAHESLSATSRLQNNEKLINESIEKPTSSSRLKRKVKESNEEVSTSKTTEPAKVSRVTRSRAK